MLNAMHRVLIAMCLLMVCLSCNGKSSAEPSNMKSLTSISDKSLEFDWDFFKLTSRSRQNFIISPVLFTRIVTILTLGSEKKLPLEFEDFFQVDPESMKKFHMAHVTSINTRKLNENIAFNGTFSVSKTYIDSLNKSYLKELDSSYNTKHQELEILSPGVLEVLNDKVEASTKRIKKFFQYGMFDYDTAAVFNTLYLKDKWKYQFKATKTILMPFYRDPMYHNNTLLEVTTMRMKNKFRVKKDFQREIKYLELPLSKDYLSLILILPLERFQLDDVITNLTGSTLKNLLKDEIPLQNVKLYLPRFHKKGRRTFKSHIQNFGLHGMFNSTSDFGTHTFNKLSNDMWGTHVDEIYDAFDLEIRPQGILGSSIFSAHLRLHNPVIDIKKSILKKSVVKPSVPTNEEKTVESEELKSSESVDFKCDEPFFIILIDKWNDIPLFWGKVDFDGRKNSIAD